jgi:uncharacterized membrane protein YhaH (DUF805 family)
MWSVSLGGQGLVYSAGSRLEQGYTNTLGNIERAKYYLATTCVILIGVVTGLAGPANVIIDRNMQGCCYSAKSQK